MTTERTRDGFWRRVRAQDGVFSLTQAHEAGFSDDAVRRRLRSGEWERAGHRVFRLADHVRTARSRVIAAYLSVGPDATVIGVTALWWWKLYDVAPAVIGMAVAPGRERAPRRGVRLRRRMVAPDDRVVVDGVAVTTRAVTVLDAAVELGERDGATVLDRALQRGSVSLDGLREAAAAMTGRRGAALIRRLLRLAAGGARSEAERLVHDGARREGITGWVADLDVELRGYGSAVLDMAFPELRIVVEIDGWAHHRDVRAFVRDEARQNALTVDGWTVLRTNWFEMTCRPEVFFDALRAVIEARSARVGRHAE